MNGNEEVRQENIRKLEALAKEVLKLKNQHRQRRPIIIEFCGSPKAGKTSSIASLNIFLKRNGFRTSVLTERASICPISDKQSPTFNVWTCTATINEINEKIDIANSSEKNNIDIILCDRGIFDALCWFRWLSNRKNMSEDEHRILSEFTLLNRWQRNIDLVYIFLTTPEESIRREYANLLTDRQGSIMNESVLEQYRASVKETLEEYKDSFRATCVVDTTNRNQNDVGYEVTEMTLQTIKDMLMERIGYVKSAELSIKNGYIKYEAIQCGLETIKYDSRELVENDPALIQPIAIAVIVSDDGKKIFTVRKNTKSTEKDSPEFGQTLLYVGGHMRREDDSPKCSCFLDVLRNTLARELFEELGISVAVGKDEVPFAIYIPDSEKSKKHLAIGWVIRMSEDTKFRLDGYELVQRKGKSKSGSFIPFAKITDPDMNLEPWSKAILQNLFADMLSDAQKQMLEDCELLQLRIEE